MAKAPLVISSLEGEAREAALGELERELEGGPRVLNVEAGLATVRELCAHAVVFEVSQGGEVLVHYALGTVRHAQACEGVVLAAAGGARGRDLTAELLPHIERQFIDVAAVTIITKRQGLAKKLARQGYGVEGYIVRKRLTQPGRA